MIDDKIVSLSSANKVIHHSLSHDQFSGYKIPESITYILQGTTQDKERVHIELILSGKRLCSKIDVLGELPYLLKVFIQTFITAPYVYQWYEETSANVTIGDVTRSIKGYLFAETSFLGRVTDNDE